MNGLLPTGNYSVTLPAPIGPRSFSLWRYDRDLGVRACFYAAGNTTIATIHLVNAIVDLPSGWYTLRATIGNQIVIKPMLIAH